MKYIYLLKIETFDVYKIGFTKNNPERRRKELQTGNPYKIILVDQYQSPIATKIESVMHSYFKHRKTHEEFDFNLMGEWFELPKEIVDNFKDKCKKIEDNLNCINSNSLNF